MAPAALPETLQSITAVKIQEVTNQRRVFETAKADILAAASEATSTSDLQRTQRLLDGVRHLKKVRLSTDDGSDDDDHIAHGATAAKLRNINKLLQQTIHDPSSPPTLLTSIQDSLRHDLELASIRYQHAEFFSKLVTDWLVNEDSSQSVSPSDGSSSPVDVGRKEMHEQRQTWEALVFDEAKIDTSKLEEYLKRVFTSNKAAEEAHKDIVRSTKTFGADLRGTKELFTPKSLGSTLEGLINTDLLSEDKVATLRAFRGNDQVLKEVADVLNMRFVSLSTWNWTTSPNGGIPVEMRRQLNGKYRVFMDEDVLDALLIYEIGMKWAVHLKATLTAFFDSLAWNKGEQRIPKLDSQRREHYLSDDGTGNAIWDKRRDRYRKDYLLTQLPFNESSGKRNYDENNADDDDFANTTKQKGGLELKHGLLHLLVAESLLAKHLRPEDIHTVIRSDFKWFGPAMPHATVYGVLKFFGVDAEWLQFFQRFLEAPLYFHADGPGAEVRTRKRGLPMSHTLTDVFGEAVLFVMDYAVSQATSTYLYRLHDDFWLWGSEDVCMAGWRAMNEFAEIMGIEFNRDKTGTVRMGDAASVNVFEETFDETSTYTANAQSLPPGDVRWGFLQLDATSGSFVVDQAQVDEHIKELRLQLSYCKSTFSYIQSYNAYVGRFFTNNFGKPSYGFGRSHVDMMIETFARIMKEMFPTGRVTDHLATIVADCFGVRDLPQGFWFFPVEQGGLELRNPLVPLLGVREGLRKSPERLLADTLRKEEGMYRVQEQVFKDKQSRRGYDRYLLGASERLGIVRDDEDFLPLDEYLQYREERSKHYGELYEKLLSTPEEETMESTHDIRTLLEQGEPELSGADFLKRKPGFSTDFDYMQPYWRWILALYGPEIVRRYGSVSMVESGQVPLGVVNLLRKRKVKWRG